MKLCNTCNIEKDESLFHFRGKNSKSKKPFCIECERKKDKIRRQSEEYKKRVSNYRTKEEKIERLNKWKQENPEKIKKPIKKTFSPHKNRLSESVRRRLKKYLKIKNITKKNKTFDIVGCTPQELLEYIESKFTNGMSWDNYGFYGWHIDHIIPLSSANNEEELYKLCHYTNLQPLWAKDNLTKWAHY